MIGVLAVQGGFALHARTLEAMGVEVLEVRSAADLQKVDGLVMPGGESTAQLRLLNRHGLVEPLKAFVAAGKPVLATCAGLILASTLGFLDVEVKRNAWGRQLDSFEGTADDGATPLVFIRAPKILGCGKGVEVLATLDGEPVLVRQGRVTAATFHPELTPSAAIHRAAFAL